MLFKPTQSREGGFDSTGLVGQDLVHGSTSTHLQYAQKSFTHGVKYLNINFTKYKKRIICDPKSLISFCINLEAAILVSSLSMVHILIATDVNVCIKIDYVYWQSVDIDNKSEVIYLITWNVFASVFSFNVTL